MGVIQRPADKRCLIDKAMMTSRRPGWVVNNHARPVLGFVSPGVNISPLDNIYYVKLPAKRFFKAAIGCDKPRDQPHVSKPVSRSSVGQCQSGWNSHRLAGASASRRSEARTRPTCQLATARRIPRPTSHLGAHEQPDLTRRGSDLSSTGHFELASRPRTNGRCPPSARAASLC